MRIRYGGRNMFDVLVVFTDHIPPKGWLAINLFGAVFVRNEYRNRLGDDDLNHENIHTRQMRDTLFVGFYILYGLEWLWWCFRKIFDHEIDPYMSVSFEREAYLNQYDMAYLKNRGWMSSLRYLVWDGVGYDGHRLMCRRPSPYRYIKSSFICMRYPFLYPRNVIHDRHYVDPLLIRKATDAFCHGHSADKLGWTDKRQKFIYYALMAWHNVKELFHCIPYYTYLDNLESTSVGWYNAFGRDLVRDLDKALRKDGVLLSFRIEGIKEKFGELDISMSGYTDSVYDVVAKYTEISRTTCITCGKPADVRTSARSWMAPYCMGCYNANHPDEELSWTRDGGYSDDSV